MENDKLCVLNKTLFYTKRIFGLAPIEPSSSKDTFSKLQLLLACFYCVCYLAIYIYLENLNDSVASAVSDSFMVHYILHLIQYGLVLSTTSYYILTYYHAKEKQIILRTIRDISNALDAIGERKRLSKSGIRYSLIALIITAVAIYNIFQGILFHHLLFESEIHAIQLFEVVFTQTANKLFQCEFCMMCAVLQRELQYINEMLETLKQRIVSPSQNAIKCSTFNKYLIEVTGKHSQLTRVGRSINKVYGIQLLFNICLSYTIIICNGYISVYLMLSSTYIFFKTLVLATTTLLIFYLCELVFIVEAATRLCKEVS